MSEGVALNPKIYTPNNTSKNGPSRRSLLKSSLFGGAAAAAGSWIPVLQGLHLVRHRQRKLAATVETTAGKVRGTIRNGVQTFRIIPYGATTAAPHRFMPPQKPEPWSGVRDVYESGHMAQQIRPILAAAAGVGDRANAIGGDDCLTLNVFTPGLRDGKKRPVMFWMHGGGFNRWVRHGD